MALYSDFISKLRSDVGDFATRRFETADGDGATTVFQLAHPKVLESSYTVKVGGVTQTENTAYTLDANVGQIVFTTGNIPATGNDNVSFEYQSVNELNSDWIDIINQVLQLWRKKIWKEFANESALTSVEDQVDYATSGIGADLLAIINAEYRVSSSDAWMDMKNDTNVLFYKDLQKLHIRPAFTVSGYEIRLRGIRAFARGSTTSATFEPDEKHWPAIRRMCASLYYERRASAMLKETGAVTNEKSFETVGALFNISKRTRQEAEELLKNIRVGKPAMTIPNVIGGVNI